MDRSINLDIVFTLAYDRARRAYVLLNRPDDGRESLLLDDEVALQIIRQIERRKSERTAVRKFASAVIPQRLNPKEALVLEAVAEGLTNRAIASRLRITENTTKRHLQSIFAKLEVQSRTQAVMVALANGLIPSGVIAGGVDR